MFPEDIIYLCNFHPKTGDKFAKCKVFTLKAPKLSLVKTKKKSFKSMKSKSPPPPPPKGIYIYLPIMKRLEMELCFTMVKSNYLILCEIKFLANSNMLLFQNQFKVPEYM